jgi:uncharacterized membrane protein YoaK (UPF0700 family)
MNGAWQTQNVLLAGYVLCFVFLNGITYLISSFYRKKFNQVSLRVGFLIAMLAFSAYVPCLFIHSDACKAVQTLLLLAGSGASIWNSVVLYLTMKQVRK